MARDRDSDTYARDPYTNCPKPIPHDLTVNGEPVRKSGITGIGNANGEVPPKANQ